MCESVLRTNGASYFETLIHSSSYVAFNSRLILTTLVSSAELKPEQHKTVDQN